MLRTTFAAAAWMIIVPGNVAAQTAAPAPSQRAGSAQGTPANSFGLLASGGAGLLNAPAPVTTSAAIDPVKGGDVLAGNVGLSIPAGALPANGGAVSVSVQAHSGAPAVPGGPFQYSPNGTLIDVSLTDQTGRPVTTFAQPVTLVLRYNEADVTMARANSGILTAAYQIDPDSPALENPQAYPSGTWVLFNGSDVTQDLTAGTVTVRTRAIGSFIGIFTQPVGFVRTLDPSVAEYSGWNDQAQVFGTRPAGMDLQVMAPQIGRRLLVLDPFTNDLAYVDATTVGPADVFYQPTQGHTTTATVGVQ